MNTGRDVGISPSEVERYLKDLDRFDLDRRFIHHRRATLFAAQGHWQSALSDAELACETNPNSFECFALRVDILIEMSRFPEASEALKALETQFEFNKDVQNGLKIKRATREGRWPDALAEWNGLKDKQRPVHQALLMRIKELQAQDLNL